MADRQSSDETGIHAHLLLSAGYLILFAAALALRPTQVLPTVPRCAVPSIIAGTSETDQSRFQACANRCSIVFCQDTQIQCWPGDQRVCNDGLTSCTAMGDLTP
jgi:hypothetical protein